MTFNEWLQTDKGRMIAFERDERRMQEKVWNAATAFAHVITAKAVTDAVNARATEHALHRKLWNAVIQFANAGGDIQGDDEILAYSAMIDEAMNSPFWNEWITKHNRPALAAHDAQSLPPDRVEGRPPDRVEGRPPAEAGAQTDTATKNAEPAAERAAYAIVKAFEPQLTMFAMDTIQRIIEREMATAISDARLTETAERGGAQ